MLALGQDPSRTTRDQGEEAATMRGARTRSRLLTLAAAGSLVVCMGCTSGSDKGKAAVTTDASLASASAAAGGTSASSTAPAAASGSASTSVAASGTHPAAVWPT